MFALGLLLLACVASLTHAQLTMKVGPTTASSAKRTTICNVLNYGGAIGSSDIGPAILSAYNNCVLKNSGSTLYVPAGKYNMQTWVTLNGGTKWAFQLDGFLTRTSTTSGHMIVIQNANDFEMYSSTSAGGIQGNGYQCRNAGPRLIRIITSTSWSLHDLVLVDSPEFHVVVQTGSRGEIYNLAIRGSNIGGSDGIDISGDNHWVHDVEVTNRDECVTIKSPATNMMVERIWCNQSGGSAFGSLGADTAISNIVYQNTYTNEGGNQAMMFKSNGGSGYVRNVLLQNFISRSTAYGLYINQYWASMTPVAGNGVQLSNITFKNWDGNVADGVARPPIALICADGAPCSSITLNNVNMWSLTGSAIAKCESAFGSGLGCIKSGSATSYAVVTSTMAKPSGYTTPSTMAGDLSAGYTSVSAIPTPTIPSSFYPGLPAISALAKDKQG
ncbi:rhamnogalacturonase [Crepidotus variabilis]|uniref:Rhamnogalacturonase n=1 Tax=Crepidotus variabilis TaxID=179855 RepID=A0A9P6ECV5_9AGAR|nr:rhamnogalacturonase [Crepidotus variabilis]